MSDQALDDHPGSMGTRPARGILVSAQRSRAFRPRTVSRRIRGSVRRRAPRSASPSRRRMRWAFLRAPCLRCLPR
jgi:hypothetical protein